MDVTFSLVSKQDRIGIKQADHQEMHIVMIDRRCEICGTANRSVDSYDYGAEYSYDNYYQTDSVKVCPYSSRLECVDTCV